jgi:hypothetical protein
MEEIKIEHQLLDKYQTASDYHQTVLCTSRPRSRNERKYRNKLAQIKCKIRLLDSSFNFEPTKHTIEINYSLFNQNIEELLITDINLLMRVEFNFVSHHCCGQMFAIYLRTQVELENLKYLILLQYESKYLALIRIAIISSIISD